MNWEKSFIFIFDGKFTFFGKLITTTAIQNHFNSNEFDIQCNLNHPGERENLATKNCFRYTKGTKNKICQLKFIRMPF